VSGATAPHRAPTIGWRPAALLVVAAGGVLLVVALAFRDPVPLFLAVPLLLAPAALSFVAPAPEGEATLDWASFGEGSQVEVRGTLTPPPGMRPADLFVDLPIPGALAETAPPERTVRGGVVELRYHWWAPRPCLVGLSPPAVLWQDALGLAGRNVVVDGPTLHVERFPPELARLGRAKLRRTTPQPGEVRSSRIGSSGEFFAVRGAAPSDTSRQINWRASARAGRLLSNDYLLERTGDLLILLDLRPSPLGPQRDAAVTAVARSAALGIAAGFLSEKSRVGVGLYSEFLESVPLGNGRAHRYRIARLLESARPSEESGPPERLAVAVRRRFPPGVTTLLISPLADLEDSLVMLRALRQRGFGPIVLSPSPLALDPPRPGRPTEDGVLLARFERVSRRLAVARAWEEAPVVEWTDLWSLGPLVRFLSTPRRAPGGRA
jgi:uncharacterized protein (DUF58 family)